MMWLLLFPACSHVNRNTPAGTQTVMLDRYVATMNVACVGLFLGEKHEKKNVRIITLWQLSLPQFHIVLFSTLLQCIYSSAVHPLISFNFVSGLGT
jgi:hypothetical protein